MEEGRLQFTFREVSNGWILEVEKDGEAVEFIFTRPNPGLNMMRKIINGDNNPFEDEE